MWSVVLFTLAVFPAVAINTSCVPVSWGSYDDVENDAYEWFHVTHDLANDTYDRIHWNVTLIDKAVLRIDLVYREPSPGAPHNIIIWRVPHDFGIQSPGYHSGVFEDETSYGLLYSVSFKLIDESRAQYEHVGDAFGVVLCKTRN